MFTKILIANRGEIACRVMTTARRLGVKTVAVYSDADAAAKHVALADEAVHIGASPAAESYLQADRIIAAAQATGAQAIHPGYGFLSENPDFVEAVEAAGLVFIGPPADAIRAMGLKDAAKALMEKTNVPVVPGYHGNNQDPEFLANEAQKIGYPVLIKARAGGGGKGMRLVEEPGDFHTALEGAQREGQASFGDPACLIEKYITQPRHIEIQVFGDAHGHAVHLFERDCSLQRRHQKVIEEAPAPEMPEDVREAMGRAAVEAAKAINYAGAGTVEFIVDGSGPLRADGFWFMEMNTRLQVEHPVSEAITGLDFVELQLRVAAGEPLPVSQKDLAIEGWSFEARLCAEDVPKGFLPAIGTLDHLTFPEASTFENGALRIDSGVRQGDDISPFYDPMIAKIVTHGPTRATALNRLRTALAECRVVGSVTNLAFLHQLTLHDGFAAGRVDTGLIARDLDQLTAPAEDTALAVAVAGLVAMDVLTPDVSSPDPWESLSGWRHWQPAAQFVSLMQGDQQHDLKVIFAGKDEYSVAWDDHQVDLTAQADGDRLRIQMGERQVELCAVLTGDTVAVFHDGQSHTFQRLDPLVGEASQEGQGDAITAPMPGLVKVVSAKAGDTVQQGDSLLLLEAMKMEHTLAAPRDGVVAEILVTVGDQVTDGALLLTMEPDDG